MKQWIAVLLTLTLLLTPMTATAQEQSTQPQPIVPILVGDVNGDGKIGADDALAVLCYITHRHPPQFPVEEESPTDVTAKPSKPTIDKTIANVDDDENITATDALYILKRVVGKIDRFPAEPMTEELENKEIWLQSVWAEEYDSQSGSLLAAKLQQMQADHGTAFRVEALEASQATETIVKNALAGIPQADVVEVSLVMARNIYRAGGSLNLIDAPLRRRLKANGSTQSVTINNHLAGVSLNTTQTMLGVVYNKDLIAKYAPDVDIASLVATNQWNFDAFRSLSASLITDTDGNSKTDIYGFTSNTNVSGMACAANVGGTALLKNGRVEASFCSQAGVDALEWCKAMFRTDKSWLYKADINNCINQFVNGKAGMFLSYTRFVPQIAEAADFEIGFAPMPMGPQQSNYINAVYDTRVYVIPKNSAASVNKVCAFLEQMMPLEDEVLANVQQEWTALGLDEQSIQNYKNLAKNSSAEFSSGVFSSAVTSEFDVYISGTPTKNWETIRAKAQKEADDYYAPFYE
ncbi:MAG: extracellular solute-binding protein [Clostridia bacterium]|nr:extracellular solute-binding protein [Clostridia bacterium]